MFAALIFFSRMWCKWNHTVGSLLSLASFTQLNALESPLLRLFHGMDVPHCLSLHLLAGVGVFLVLGDDD